jgi:hypothetical protein
MCHKRTLYFFSLKHYILEWRKIICAHGAVTGSGPGTESGSAGTYAPSHSSCGGANGDGMVVAHATMHGGCQVASCLGQRLWPLAMKYQNFSLKLQLNLLTPGLHAPFHFL